MNTVITGAFDFHQLQPIWRSCLCRISNIYSATCHLGLVFLFQLLGQISELSLNPWNILYLGWLMFHMVNISNTMGSWPVCSAHDNGDVQSLEILASSALCKIWGLKTIFRFCEQLQLPDWAVNHPVPANITLISWYNDLTQGSLVALSGKHLLPETQDWSLCHEYPLEKGMATQSTSLY